MTHLAEVRARHVRLPADGDAVPRDSCYCCGQPWPCDVARLAEADGEYCQRCGRAYWRLGYWMADDALWTTVTGRSDGAGLFCPDCFGEMATERGLLLRWTPTVDPAGSMVYVPDGLESGETVYIVTAETLGAALMVTQWRRHAGAWSSQELAADILAALTSEEPT